ncbi:Com family DNA-binding transcriptional regulator [Phaeobacter inhibens]|uniref:Com family DNA-binding transcriptional regulator n=1 Tax=Phaeobacter inhibens TaxID=221822 RepID=UPI0009E85A00
MELQDQRCGECRRLLFKIEPGALSGTLAIKCPRCKAHNTLRPASPLPERRTDERLGKEGRNAEIAVYPAPAARTGQSR